MNPIDRPVTGKKRRYKELVAAVERAINEADPIGLLEIGAPPDEYAPEIGPMTLWLSCTRSSPDGLATTPQVHDMRTRRRREGSGMRLSSTDRVDEPGPG
jgi:hypothetical protein